jgi:sensor c-di-GMP phosphodiesterase-like protein
MIIDRLVYIFTQSIYKQFILFWILVTSIVLLFCSYILWQNQVSNLWYHQVLLAIDLVIISYCCYGLLHKPYEEEDWLLFSIRKAIKQKHFYPVYQPVFDAQSNQHSGVEVLLRWQGGHNEIIMPDIFIREAESTGLIVPITLQIIEIAFKDLKEILNRNSQFHLSFNVCALHFTESCFFEQFYALIDHYSISLHQIVLEITERELLDVNNQIYIQKMHELRKKGISLAIDDYGTGNASISYLQYFPFNYLKIDKLFIQAIGSKAITESLTGAIIDLAKKINLIIIAEGVETKEQVNYLIENNIHLLQGWYFSKALSIRELKNLLQGGEK